MGCPYNLGVTRFNWLKKDSAGDGAVLTFIIPDHCTVVQYFSHPTHQNREQKASVRALRKRLRAGACGNGQGPPPCRHLTCAPTSRDLHLAVSTQRNGQNNENTENRIAVYPSCGHAIMARARTKARATRRPSHRILPSWLPIPSQYSLPTLCDRTGGRRSADTYQNIRRSP